jgi:hypothetical protein
MEAVWWCYEGLVMWYRPRLLDGERDLPRPAGRELGLELAVGQRGERGRRGAAAAPGVAAGALQVVAHLSPPRWQDAGTPGGKWCPLPHPGGPGRKLKEGGPWERGSVDMTTKDEN